MVEDKKLRGGFVQVHRAVIADDRLNDGSFRLYCYMLDRRNSENKTVWTTQETMAHDLGVTSKTIESRLKDLYSVGLVKKDKLKKWPKTGRKVWGNRLCYSVYQAKEIYSERQLRFNWNNEKENSVLNADEIYPISIENNFSVLDKETTSLIPKQISGSIIEQDIIGTIKNEEQERTTIKDESVMSVFNFYCELLLRQKRIVPRKPLKRDLETLKMMIETYGYDFTRGLIANSILLWSDVQNKYPKLIGTEFQLATLQSLWLHPLTEFYKKQHEASSLQNTDEFIEVLKSKNGISWGQSTWENDGGWGR